jgi:hypothetical protein
MTDPARAPSSPSPGTSRHGSSNLLSIPYVADSPFLQQQIEQGRRFREIQTDFQAAYAPIFEEMRRMLLDWPWVSPPPPPRWARALGWVLTGWIVLSAVLRSRP